MRTLIFAIVSILLVFSAHGQVKKHVSWTYETKKISEKEYQIIFKAKPEKDWHFYTLKDKLNPLLFNFKRNNFYILKGRISESPKPKVEYDELMESERSYHEKEAIFNQNIEIKSNEAFNIDVSIEYQACLLDGMCVMEEYDFSIPIKPEKNETNIDTTNIALNNDSNISPIDTNEASKQENVSIENNNTPVQNEQNSDNDSLWLFFLFSFLAGLAAILTPCVFPMIPMTVSFFMHNDTNRRKAKFQAIAYGISIISIYTIIGTIVAITLGANFANFLSTHWLPNVFFFLIFLIFAFSFFGMFEIVLPSWLVNKSDQKAEKGGLLGPFFMAFTLVLVSFSCTGPIVGAILVKSAGGQVLEPIIGMFGFSLAFALPFTIFALFPSLMSKLPKSGGWLNSVKVVLGFLELALGLKFLSIADQTYHWGILDREIYLAIWIVIFTLMGFYLLGKIKFIHDSDVNHIGVPRLILSIITFSFVIYMLPGMWGAPLKALSGYLPPQNSLDFDFEKIVRETIDASSHINNSNHDNELCEKPKYADFLHLPHGLKGYFDYEQALQCAKKQNKPLFIDFTGHGCVNCREMEANVWSDPRVLKRLRENYIVVALYVDDKTELPKEDWIVSKIDGKTKTSIGKKFADFQISRFNVNAQPYYVLLDTSGNLIIPPRAYNLDVEAFIQFLDDGLQKFHQTK
ncbi:MAG: thioredoxin family protein [Bacteroidales bacterium]|nr:thioredoxin family protein [Bacteroidales bacterium]